MNCLGHFYPRGYEWAGPLLPPGGKNGFRPYLPRGKNESGVNLGCYTWTNRANTVRDTEVYRRQHAEPVPLTATG